MREDKLVKYLRCVECGSSVFQSPVGLECESCSQVFHRYRSIPVFLRQDNSLFPPDRYLETTPVIKPSSRNNTWKSTLKKIIPSKSVNLCRTKVLESIAYSLDNSAKVLVIGCGTQRSELETAFAKLAVELIYLDIDQSSDCDVFADAHVLPFFDDSFSGVITTAVLEHVIEPWVVASEISRVTIDGGFIYSELPFLQGVHEGAYDFTRFTLTGHRGLFRSFEEVESGLVAGPGTTFVWAACALAQSLFRNPTLSRMADVATRFLCGWVKYLDRYTKNHHMAEDFASCTYYWGRKTDKDFELSMLISKYGGSSHSHFKE